MSYVGKVTANGATHLIGSTLYGSTQLSAYESRTWGVTCSSFDELFTGVTIHVQFLSSDATGFGISDGDLLNVNNTGAYPISNLPTLAWSGPVLNIRPGGVVSFTFDGTSWVLNAPMDSDTTYQTITTNELNSGTSVYQRVVTPKVIHDYVASQMSDVAGALVYKGTVSAGTALLNTALKKGWYYIVDTAGSYAGATCEPGDMIIVNTAGTYTTASALSAAVDIIQTNIDTITNAEIDTIVAS